MPWWPWAVGGVALVGGVTAAVLLLGESETPPAELRFAVHRMSRRLTLRRPARLLGLSALLVGLTGLVGCQQEPAQVTVYLQLAPCLGSSFAGSVCRDALDAAVGPGPENGCLVVRTADGATRRLAVRWSDGNVAELADGAVDVTPGASVDAAFFLLAAGTGCAGLDVQTDCTAAAGCVLKMLEPDLIAEDELLFDFTDLEGTCRVEPGPPLVDAERCNGEDDDCDGVADEGFAIGDACSAGLGACAATGETVCADDGASVACDAQAGAPGEEICGGALDEDCGQRRLPRRGRPVRRPDLPDLQPG